MMSEQLSWLPPEWLQKLSDKAKGRDLNKFRMLDEFYQETEAVRVDRFDRKQYQRLLGNAEEIKKLSESRHVDVPSWETLIQDEYLSFYKARPQVRAEGEMRPTYRTNRATMATAMKTKEWEELRTYTMLDEWASAMAALEFGVALGAIYDEQDEIAKKNALKAQEQEQTIDDYLDELEKQSESDDMTEELAEQALDDLQDMLDEYEQIVDDMQGDPGGQPGPSRQQIKQALEQATEQVKDANELVTGFGTDAGALQRMDGKRRMALAARIKRSNKLHELAQMVGRFKALALGQQASKIVHGRDEIHDVEIGDDIARVLPSEFSYLASKDTEVLFYEKFAEKKLMQYKLRGTEKVAKGAIIIMVDNSGSMSGVKELWAKAVALALLEIAHKQKRDFYGIHFSSRNEMKEWFFPKGLAGPEDVLDYAEHFFSGGTDFEAPISRAVEVLEKQFNDDGGQKGDLVLVTDGDAPVSDEWLKRYLNAKEDLAFRMYGCIIGTNYRTVERMADNTYSILELARGDDVKEIFGAV